VIYSFGPHIKFGDQKFTNAYWGISPEQSARTGLDQYHADAGITAYGVGAFALMPLTKSVSVSLIAGYDRLAAPVANSPLVKERGSENQAIGGLFVSYGF
jgi:outer membrane protein